MEKQELKDQLSLLVERIKANSKDAHFAKSLIDDLLSVKGQMTVEPTELDCGNKVDEYKGSSYRITLTTKGVLYHEYGGYNIFVTPNIKGIYDILADIVTNKDKYAGYDGEDKERITLAQSAVVWVLQSPKVALTNETLTYEIASSIVAHVQKIADEAFGQDLQDEDVEKDEMFRSATVAMESIKDEMKKESE